MEVFLGECENAWYQGMDDSAFRDVLVPHDWAVEQPFSEQYSSGTGYLAGGIGWYRLHFKVPKEAQGKRISLVFDGVYKNSQVWVNSYYLGRHPYGYTGFSYDISQMVHFGEEDNVASVKVSHPDLADSRWFTGSGVVRRVVLRIQEWVHQAEHGVYLVTKELDGERAVLQIHHEVMNDSDKDCRIQVETELETPDGETVLHLEHEAWVRQGNAAPVCGRQSLCIRGFGVLRIRSYTGCGVITRQRTAGGISRTNSIRVSVRSGLTRSMAFI